MMRFRELSPAAVRGALNGAAMVILLTGLTAAFIIWRAHDNDTGQLVNPALPLAVSDSQKQSREIEIYYGKIGVLFERCSEEIATLSHGKPLAKSIAIASGFLAITCVLIGARAGARSRPGKV